MGTGAVAMSKARGTCVFCGGTGLTKGHVWPDLRHRSLPQSHGLALQLWLRYELFRGTLSQDHSKPANGTWRVS
jgi:hypothetical protein